MGAVRLHELVEDCQAFRADPRDARQFEAMCRVQVIYRQEAGVDQGPRSAERQPFALPGFGCQPILLE